MHASGGAIVQSNIALQRISDRTQSVGSTALHSYKGVLKPALCMELPARCQIAKASRANLADLGFHTLMPHNALGYIYIIKFTFGSCIIATLYFEVVRR